MPSCLAPTLVEAVRALTEDRRRGFVFVGPDGGERLYTFHDMAAEAQRRANQLVARGLRKGDRIAIVVPEGDEFVLSFLGTLFAGMVAVPISPQSSFRNLESYHDMVAHIARASGARLLLTTRTTKAFVEPALERARTLHAVLTMEDLAQPIHAPSIPRSPHADPVAVSPDDLALLQFTSGSTSRPKGVMVTHGNLAANAESFMIHGLRETRALTRALAGYRSFMTWGS